ncbi:OXA1L protein, partial [Smithornis capensis]|nr:OXA1L protein [Smithornis capensis]
ARLTQHLPQIQKLNQRLAEAKRGADPNQVARAYTELVSYQQRHDVNPLRGFLVPLVQTPVFVSFFLALQGMAAVPVPGLLSGGLGWFMDLSSHDPYYVLPVLVTASTWLVLELGAETGVSAPGAGAMRQLLRLLPLFFLPFILHFPTLLGVGGASGKGGASCEPFQHLVGVSLALIGSFPQAVFTYWLTSNSFSLLQTLLLRVPALRAKVGMAPPPATATPTPTGFPQKKKEGLLTRLKKGI